MSALAPTDTIQAASSGAPHTSRPALRLMADQRAAPKKKASRKKKNGNKPKDPLDTDSAAANRENDDVSDEPETPGMVLTLNESCVCVPFS